MAGVFDLNGRVALITGAGQGIGRETALLFADHGVEAIVVNDFHLDRAEAVAASLRARNIGALAVQCDVTDYASVTAMVGKAIDRFGRVDPRVRDPVEKHRPR